MSVKCFASAVLLIIVLHFQLIKEIVFLVLGTIVRVYSKSLTAHMVALSLLIFVGIF